VKNKERKIKKVGEKKQREVKTERRPPYFYWKVYITPRPHGFH